MDRMQPVNISAFIIPPSYLHMNCKGSGAGAAYCSWNILGGRGRSQYPSAERSQEGKSPSWRPVGWKAYCLGCNSIQTVFSWCLGCNDMIMSLLNCWPLQCLDFLVTPLWRAPFTQECLPSCRSSSRAAVLRSWTQHHGLWEREKQRAQEE